MSDKQRAAFSKSRYRNAPNRKENADRNSTPRAGIAAADRIRGILKTRDLTLYKVSVLARSRFAGDPAFHIPRNFYFQLRSTIAVRNAAGKLVMECAIETKASIILDFIHGLCG